MLEFQSLPDFVAEIQELKQMIVELDSDPDQNIGNLNALYAKVQGYLSRVAEILIEMHEALREARKAASGYKTAYALERAKLLSTSIEIQQLKNQSLQEAAVMTQLRSLFEQKEQAERDVDDLELLIKITQQKMDDLDKLNTNLSRQQKVVETLIGIGHQVKANRG
jgi:NifU-like protein involved in Fe-S cluster formation